MTPLDPSTSGGSEHPAARPEAELPALRWLRRAQAEDDLLAAVNRRVRRRKRRWLAAGSVGVVLLLGGLWWSSAVPWSVPTAVITRPEERVLPDGSKVALKAGAQVDVHYSDARRRVILRQGEAHFQVKKSERPFVVEASGVEVQAVGTAFSVQLDADQVEVLVSEGRVQVAPLVAPTPAAGPATVASSTSAGESLAVAFTSPVLEAGHRVIIPRDALSPQISVVSLTELAERLAWRIPNLEFSRTPLDEAVELMNENAEALDAVRFVLLDDELRRVRLSGYLRADNSEGLVRLLESNFGVRAERSGNVIGLRKAP